MNKKRAVYPLSADPVHDGHIYTLTAAVNSGLFDEVFFSLGTNPAKKYFFSEEERFTLAQKAVAAAGLDERVVVEHFSGLLRNYATEKGIDVIIRGVRNARDVDYEMTLAEFNRGYGLQTMFFPAPPEVREVSSSIVKAIASEGGLVHDYVHPVVKQALEERLSGMSLVGVTGMMGVGKTTFCQRLTEYARSAGIAMYHLDFDALVHSLYNGTSPLSGEVKEKIKSTFGEDLFDGEQLNRKKLAPLVFGNGMRRSELTSILRIPVRVEFEQQLRGMTGIILVDAAYLTEYTMLPLVNHNAILLTCFEEERRKRVIARDRLTIEEITAIQEMQHTTDQKKMIIQYEQQRLHHGFFVEVDSGMVIDYGNILKQLTSAFPLFPKTEVKK